MSKFWSWFVIILLAGCQSIDPTPTTQPEFTLPHTPTREVTLTARPDTPALSFLTPEPPGTAEPISFTEVPIQFGDPSFAPLIPDGAVARIGLGHWDNLIVSPDGSRVAVASSIGVHIYDSVSLEHLWSAATTRDISDLDWSPDGNFLAVGLSARSAVVYDANSGERLWSFDDYLLLRQPDLSDVLVEFSPDGRYLATSQCIEGEPGFNDYCITDATHIWNPATGQLISNHAPAVGLLQWSPDSSSLLSGIEPYEIWFPETNTTLGVDNFITGARSILLNHTADQAVVRRQDESMLLVTWPDVSIIDTLPFDNLTSIRWSPDDTHLLFTPYEEDPAFYDLNSGRIVKLPGADTGRQFSFVRRVPYAWSPDGSILVTGMRDSSDISIWNLRDGANLAYLTLPESFFIRAITWSPTGNILLVVQDDSLISHLLSIDPNDPTNAISTSSYSNWKLAANWTNEQTILVGTDYGLEEWDPQSLRLVSTCTGLDSLKGHNFFQVQWLDFEKNHIAVANWNEPTVRYLDMNTCEVIRAAENALLRPTDSRIFSPASSIYPDEVWSPDGLLRAENVAGWLVIRHVDTGDQLISREDEIPMGSTRARHSYLPAWSPDSTMIAVAHRDDQSGTNSVRVIDVNTKKTVYDYAVPHSDINNITMSWSPDGHYLAIFDSAFASVVPPRHATYLSVHDMESRSLLYMRDTRLFDMWPQPVSDILWSMDGETIIAAHGLLFLGPEATIYDIQDQAVLTIWDTQTGDRINTLRGHTNDIIDLEWSPDRQTLVSTSVDGTIILWDFSEYD